VNEKFKDWFVVIFGWYKCVEIDMVGIMAEQVFLIHGLKQ
jgi:hypothetical protein